MDITTTPFPPKSLVSDLQTAAVSRRNDPREEMARRLPRQLQSFLTWLTAQPAPGERRLPRKRYRILVDAGLWMAAGIAISTLALQSDGLLAIFLFAIGVIATTSGMGIVQVIVFHYCAHGDIFSNKNNNVILGRLISILFLFTNFDKYKTDHLQHHRAQKLITDDDEFTTFVLKVCRLKPGDRKARLWRHVILSLLSPIFHGRFLLNRVRGSLLSGSAYRMAAGLAFWGALIWCTFYMDIAFEFLLVWVLPLTAPLQAATVLRILCEHRFPTREVLLGRGKLLICHATTGVFPGRLPPAESAATPLGLGSWALWWIDLLTVQLFARIFVLVGDAPCHDFHHRRPGAGNWVNAVYSRQQDKENGCPGYPVNYIDVWGLFTAIDGNLESLSRMETDIMNCSRDSRPARAAA